MLGKNKIKLIRSLESKKHRSATGLFVAEGHKSVSSLLPFFRCELLVAKPSWMATQGDLAAGELIAVDDDEMARASLLKTPADVIAVFVQPPPPGPTALDTELTLVLDGIQDPGNLGTILRITHWFGIRHLICSPDTADVYNPKTVQASMGSLAHVRVSYTPLPALLSALPPLPVYGTFLTDSHILHKESLTPNGLIVMGNEGSGIRPEIEPYITRRLYIPAYPPTNDTVESLNVAVATAVVCAEFRRQQDQSKNNPSGGV
jgi:TrmH family RNA methyltransferase